MKSLTLLAIAAVAALAGCDAKAPVSALPTASAPDAQVTVAPTAPEAATPVPNVAVAANPRAPAPTQPYRPAPPSIDIAAPPAVDAGVEQRDEPVPIYSAYRPAISQPVPVAVPWAPPPMLVEAPPPPPSRDARWTGGYWVWHERWVWAPGRWAEPPRPRYQWVPPYYEHRRDRVVFVDGFWSPPGVAFVPPPPNLSITLAIIGAGIALGRPPIGPEGVFVPPPPGSRRGLIVMAPIGTAPAVVTGAPPIVAPGMRVTNNFVRNDQRTTIVNNNRSTTVVNNVTNVTIEAPAGSTADHRAVRQSVPAQAHLAAALPAVQQHEPAPTERPATPKPDRARILPQPPAAKASPAPLTATRPPERVAPAPPQPAHRAAPVPPQAQMAQRPPAPPARTLAGTRARTSADAFRGSAIVPKAPAANVERPHSDRREPREPAAQLPPAAAHAEKPPGRHDSRPAAVAAPPRPTPATPAAAKADAGKAEAPAGAHHPTRDAEPRTQNAKDDNRPHKGGDPAEEAARKKPREAKGEPGSK